MREADRDQGPSTTMKAPTGKKVVIPVGGKPRAASARKQAKKAKQVAQEASEAPPKDAAEDEVAPALPPPKEPSDSKKQKKRARKAKKKKASESKEAVAEKTKQGDKDAGESSEEDSEDGEPKEPKGVIYLGNIPAGFEEGEIKHFFTQFGKMTRLRLVRSKRTGRPKGYAFIEFKEASVAQIVAETMDKYLLYGKQMKSFVTEKTPRMFEYANKIWTDRRPERREKYRTNYNDRPTLDVDGEEIPQATCDQIKRRIKKRKALEAKLLQYGVDFDVGEVVGNGDAALIESELPSLPKKPKAEGSTEEASEAAKKQTTVDAKADAHADAKADASADVDAGAKTKDAGDSAAPTKKAKKKKART